MAAAGFEELDTVVFGSPEPFQFNAIMVAKPSNTPKLTAKKITLFCLPGDENGAASLGCSCRAGDIQSTCITWARSSPLAKTSSPCSTSIAYS